MEKQNQLAVSPATSGGLNFFDPQQFETLQRVCKMFANSELVPDMYRSSQTNSIEKAMSNCMIAVDISTRIGASTLMVMQNLAIVYGKPSWSSRFLIGTVNTCGRFKTLKFRKETDGMVGKIEYTDYSWNPQTRKKEPVIKVFDGTKIPNMTCVAYTCEKGSDEVLESPIISIKMAVVEGWYTKAGSKWKTMPELMLTYRAGSMWTNTYAPELSLGMKTTEEVIDITDAEYVDITEDSLQSELKEKANKKTVSFEDEEPKPTQEATQELPEDQKESVAKPQEKPEGSTLPGF